MNGTQRSEAPTAADICRRFELSGEARKLLQPHQTAEEFFSKLVDEKLYPDALRYAAYYLQKRESVWWGCLCVWQLYRPKAPDRIAAALQAAIRWVQQPTEEMRRAAETAGTNAGMDSPAGQLALAAFFSDGSISLPGLPEVAPGPFLTNQTVAAAVLLASRMTLPDQNGEHQRRFLRLAADVSGGRVLWEPPPPATVRQRSPGRR